ncbi:hypothetical protein G5S34_17545 [Herbaspirillum frisingense]|uniref:hypothetical protein n=1 Tax=Herbaspirillum frisingense TaxID=92645 RepID=UPI00160402FA|nr:hypothetical protein [Herbaspirillum frisingense]QNB08378.1 hypothetical protein G5S34_17545 [Herbaspirillum frisingense]
MATDKTGGPAFPGNVAVGPNGEVVPAMMHGVPEGMSLRDYFAAHAPIDVGWANEIFFRRMGRNPGFQEILDQLVELRGIYADKMLKERAE